MKVADLKRELKSRSLSVTGNKTELLERLQLAVMSESDILADDPEDLNPEDLTGDQASPVPPTKKARSGGSEALPKKKVPIKRDNPVSTETPEDKIQEELDAGAPTAKKAHVPVTAETNATPTSTPTLSTPNTDDQSAPKAQPDVKVDVDKAKARAERFGIKELSDTTKKLDRANRFGLPVETPSASETTTTPGTTSAAAEKSPGKASKIGGAPTVDMDTLKKRAERFGQSTSKTLKEMEMDEKIKKRQERFGVVAPVGKNEPKPKVIFNTSVNSVVLDEKMKKRAERFGITSA
ncbi:SAP domain-containing ribonucleoprotein-like isoform X2 [Tigriopus californicus]|nr:SAP domain-containing ribonucleoprotein-like isoform X2 [Tigriopus californicus]